MAKAIHRPVRKAEKKMFAQLDVLELVVVGSEGEDRLPSLSLAAAQMVAESEVMVTPVGDGSASAPNAAKQAYTPEGGSLFFAN